MSNIDTFMNIFEEEMRANMARSPGSYSFGLDGLPGILAKFRESLSKDSYSIEGPAIKATCKRLKIRRTYGAIRAYLGRES